ncbi:MAG: DUF4412 domain-containing protein [Gemmatimonadetes bacterium]|nr:DUF4412 domain-containing protein [Gemmatimonadota bacterium]
MRRASACLLAASTLLVAAATPRVDGVKFTWMVTTTASGDAARAATPPSMSVIVAGDQMRMEMLEARPGSPAGVYTLLNAATASITMVDPSRKQAMVLDTRGTGNVMGAASAIGMKFDIADLTSTVADQGAGERILGRSTRKYHVSRSYTATMSMLGRKSSTRVKEEMDIWMTNDFAGQRAFEEFGKTLGRNTGMIGGAAQQKLMQDAEKLPKGVPLRQVINTTSTTDKGEAQTSSVTMEMTDLANGNFDASLFEVPAGYQVVDLKAQLAEASKAAEKAKADCEAKQGAGKCEGAGEINADSIIAAARSGALTGVKEGVNEGAKEAAKDAAKKALKGLFKKP